ncbi:MAG: Lipoate-protein ligase LplJ [Chlamydiae bacterium]|nr:Lipoate-protein ligase LplJ [Chlamydiota bacterium]
MKTLHLVKLKNTPIFQQLQYEEALVRADKRNWCLLNEGSSEAIVMGISGKAEQLIDERYLSVPVIRRFTGGGTVYIDANTCFVTLICNHSDVDISPFPQHILKWNGELYRDHIGNGYEVKENDYVLHGNKFGGNAQYITKDKWLHHTSLLWDYDPEKMKVLKMPPKVPSYREKRAHHEFMSRLKSVFSSKEELFEKVIVSLSKRFQVEEVTERELARCLVVPHRKATYAFTEY